MSGRAILTENIQQYLITGASRGIGRAIAGKLAQEGRKLLLHGRDGSALEETAELVRSHGASATVVVADLALESFPMKYSWSNEQYKKNIN